MKKCFVTAFFALFCLYRGLFGAEITVPELELVTRGAMLDGNFALSSSLGAEISISGGYKYGFSIGLGAEITNLQKALSYGRFDVAGYLTTPTPETYEEFSEHLNNQAFFSIRSLKATVRELFDKPLELNFFIGQHDKLGSGDEFPDYYGTPEIGTALKGFFYYPEGFNNNPFLRFNGAIHTIMGTGLSVKAILGNFIPTLYIYHDLSFPQAQTLSGQAGSYDPGRYSADFRLLANGENVKFEVFFGSTYSYSDNVVIRGGVLAYFSSGPFAFLMQAGIPYWEVSTAIDIDNCYFLMEPRLRFEKIGANLTFFYHPVYFQNRIIYDSNGIDERRGRADINLRIFYGDINKSTFEAGLESMVKIKIQDGEDFEFWISPFLSTVTTGLRWDFALRINPRFFWDRGDLMEGFIGIRTAY